MELVCKKQEGVLKGCISVNNGECKICEKGYYMDKQYQCQKADSEM
jgi:hypothetical protein